MLPSVLIFTAVIVYCSLFPLVGWIAPNVPLFSFLLTWPNAFEKADIIQNVLAYAPLGLLMVIWLKQYVPSRLALISAVFFGSSLSLIMECIQQFIPSRTPSTSDWAFNTFGTLAGAILAVSLSEHWNSPGRLQSIRSKWVRSGNLPNIGLLALVLWALSQTSPLVPTFDVGQLRHGVSLLYHSMLKPAELDFRQTVTYALYISGLGVVALTLARTQKAALIPYLCFVAFVLALKVLIVGRQLSLEAITGALIGSGMLLGMRGWTNRAVVSIAGATLIAFGFVVSETRPLAGSANYPFNWVPFIGQMASLNGFQDILDALWPGFAIAYLARYMTPPYRRAETAIAGGVILLALLFGLELLQEQIPGRYGDVTQVFLGLLGWIIPWRVNMPDYAMDASATGKSNSRNV